MSFVQLDIMIDNGKPDEVDSSPYLHNSLPHMTEHKHLKLLIMQIAAQKSSEGTSLRKWCSAGWEPPGGCPAEASRCSRPRSAVKRSALWRIGCWKAILAASHILLILPAT